MKQKMKEEFKAVDYMSATTDIWSRSNRSYIAVTVHYFNEKLELQSKFIALDRFIGNHTNIRVAQKLREIFDRFGINEKVFFITTDGAGEYTAALKYHGDNYHSVQCLDQEIDYEFLLGTAPGSEMLDADIEDDSDSETDVDAMVHNANELRTMPYNVTNTSATVTATSSDTTSNTNNGSDSGEAFVVHELFTSNEIESEPLPVQLLPNTNRISCSAHILDKLGKVDALKANSDEDYSVMYEKVFKKLRSIWGIKDSRLDAELFKRITGRQLIGPHRIRWSKTFDAVSTYYNLQFYCMKCIGIGIMVFHKINFEFVFITG